mgnify:FL=1|jgi:hypothetical protein|nr:MAG TPA: hypothetical protein [Caudoviricetes sp.]
MEKANEITLVALSCSGGKAVVKFTERGWDVLSDDRKVKDGYLHLDAAAPGGIPDDLTEPVKIQLMRYLYKHHHDLPGLGVPPQAKYFRGYSLDDLERLGNDGERGYYNMVIK